MKILKKILIVIAVIIAIPLIVALFVKKEYVVQSEITINKPSQEVFDFVKLLKNQEYYNKWVMADPNMKKDLKGTDGTVGFIYAWDGNDQVGQGEQEIKNIQDGREINTELRFIRPMEGLANTKMATIPEGGQTKVTWEMRGESKYPMNFMNLFIGKMLGKDQMTSLNRLKEILEKQ